jgi:transforming growth factor-beta-induced protein
LYLTIQKGDFVMNRVSKVLILVVAMLLLVVPLAGAAEDDMKDPTIVDIAINDGRFTTLVAAVVATDLAGTLSGGEWTVFAPTDDAFAAAGLNAGNIATALDNETLKDILLYHVLEGNVSSFEAKALLGDVTMANGQIAGLKYFDDSLWVNDDSRVIIQDIVAANGTIHVVDNVILPPWPRVAEDAEMETPTDTAAMTETETMEAAAETTEAAESESAETVSDEKSPAAIPSNSIAGIAIGDERFSTLVAAVVATDLAGALSGGEWTVFAPTDDAFAKLDLDASNIGSAFSKEELTDILLYHVLTSSVSSAEAKTLLGDVTMANGQIAGLKYFDDSLWVNDDSRVIIQDILADNGTIHVVDTVILGPWPRD